AIEAVLQPANTQDLYFVADGSGGHVFASTLAEHLVNVKNYRKIERAERAAAALAAKQSAAETPGPAKTTPAAASETKTESEPAATAPAATDKPADTGGDELPLKAADKPASTGEAAGKTAGKIPLPRPRPVIN
ncbi:MAG: endolytic transglycosylase MltG, partial [Hyphomicrobiales bacterium]|nr:endolytic transglycosylase MltG [Hyphomicrobiales bacterium]